MNTVMLPFTFDECAYLSSSILVEMLKRADNYYYLDDINFLTVNPSELALCGYFPESNPADNFYYTIAPHDPINNKTSPPKEIILNCKDVKYLERFLDLICKHNPPISTICINLPCFNKYTINSDQSIAPYTDINGLMKRFENVFEKLNCLYDYRFESHSKLKENYLNTKYRLTEVKDCTSDAVFQIYDNDCLLFEYCPNTFSCTNSIIPSLRQPAKNRLGMNVISFTDDIITKSQNHLPEDAIEFCLCSISKIYLARGYVVKNIALPTAFENEDICNAIGMTRYRQFIRYKVQF